ncbi:MAG: response regulator [Gammaproteobacteria bacterium]|nr:MAG: response regulator [Gammaproteobacteria bacterium]RLA60524.1 MAG: response regulator [Gammaproteobacteria bacterium]
MSTRDKTLLVVDDAPDNIQLLSGLLKEKYKIKAATSGEKALLVARKMPSPDLILLDVMMPGMDGYEVYRQLQADALTRSIPVVFVTGHATQEEQQRGLAMGAVAYLSKPVAPQELLSTVERVLNSL